MTTTEYSNVVTITGVLPYEMFDTIIMFNAEDEFGNELIIAVDHRPARGIIAAFISEDWDQNAVVVEIEDWQVVRRLT